MSFPISRKIPSIFLSTQCIDQSRRIWGLNANSMYYPDGAPWMFVGGHSEVAIISINSTPATAKVYSIHQRKRYFIIRNHKHTTNHLVHNSPQHHLTRWSPQRRSGRKCYCCSPLNSSYWLLWIHQIQKWKDHTKSTIQSGSHCQNTSITLGMHMVVYMQLRWLSTYFPKGVRLQYQWHWQRVLLASNLYYAI